MIEQSKPHGFLGKRISKRAEQMQILQGLKAKGLTTKTMLLISTLPFLVMRIK